APTGRDSSAPTGRPDREPDACRACQSERATLRVARCTSRRGAGSRRRAIGYDRLRLTRSFSALPGRNAGTVDALMLMVLPVCGLRPWRAARLRVSKLPKPEICTRLPFLSSDAIRPFGANSVSITSLAYAFELSSFLASASTISCLFTPDSLE